jgi:alpha-tubulin suppressor-like RCC1 family protein
MPTPVLNHRISNVTMIAAGQTHYLAVQADRTAWGWGQGSFGQSGLLYGATTSMPTRIIGVSNVVGVAAGWSVTHYLGSDGHLRAIGWNTRGQCGVGTYSSFDHIVTISNRVFRVP